MEKPRTEKPKNNQLTMISAAVKFIIYWKNNINKSNPPKALSTQSRKEKQNLDAGNMIDCDASSTSPAAGFSRSLKYWKKKTTDKKKLIKRKPHKNVWFVWREINRDARVWVCVTKKRIKINVSQWLTDDRGRLTTSVRNNWRCELLWCEKWFCSVCWVFLLL